MRRRAPTAPRSLPDPLARHQWLALVGCANRGLDIAADLAGTGHFMCVEWRRSQETLVFGGNKRVESYGFCAHDTE